MPSLSHDRRRGFTVLELLVVIFVIGILVGLTLPAVQAAREAGNRARCVNNLRQIGLALSMYESVYRSFPAGHDGFESREHSWCTAILPFLEQAGWYERYDYDRAWNDGSNAQIANNTLPVFLCPSTGHTFEGAIDYGGVYGVGLDSPFPDAIPQYLTPRFGNGYGLDQGVLTGINIAKSFGQMRQTPIRLSEIRDGLSHTVLVGEDARRPAWEGGQWANGHNCFSYSGKSINTNPSNDFFSQHGSGAHALLADGSAIYLNNNVSLQVLVALCTRDQGEGIEGDR